MTLHRLVGRLGVETFLAEYLDNKPAIIKGAGDFSDWFSYAALDELIATRGLRHPTFRLVRDSQALPPESVTIPSVPWGTGAVEALARPDALFAELARGASFVLDDLARCWEPVGQGARSLEESFGTSSFAFAFYTPAGLQTFKPHYDIHQTFIVQVEGSKAWKVWTEDVAKPLRHQKCSPDGSPTGELLIDDVLEAGDVLYIPRGFVHAGATQGDASLHVSYVVTPFTWFEVLRNAIKHFDDPLLDEPVPLDIRRDVELPDALDIAFEDLLERFAETANPADAFDRLAQVFVNTRRSLTPRLADLDAVIDGDTRLVRRPGIIHRVVDGVLSFQGTELPIPPAHVDTLLGGPFPASAIGLALATALFDQGFVEVSA